MSTISNKLRSHKNNNISFLVLLAISIIFLAIQAFNIITATRGNVFIPLIFNIIVPIIVVLIVLWYEKRGLSLTAHIMFFIFFLESYLKQFTNLVFQGTDPNNMIITVLGFIASIYIIFKVVAHSNELKASVPIIGRSVGVLIIISLFNTYIDINFTMVLTYGLIMLLAIASSNGKAALPVVMLIYATRIKTTFYSAYLSPVLSNSQRLNIIVNVLFAAFFIYIAYRELTKDHYNNNYIS